MAWVIAWILVVIMTTLTKEQNLTVAKWFVGTFVFVFSFQMFHRLSNKERRGK